MKFLNRLLLLKGCAAVLSVVLMISLVGCGQKKVAGTAESKGSSAEVKKMPDNMTEINLGLPSKANMSYVPLYVAVKKGYYQKKNLNVKLTFVQGGVLTLRGLQSGDFQLISSLPESVITGVAEGANAKIIGTLDNQSMYSIFLGKDIKDVKDLKGKVAAGNVTGNGTSIQLEYWLKKQGLEPNKDIRIINAGDNAERLQAVQQGQAAVTILSPPTDLKAISMGLKRYLMRDELIKNKPEVVYAFMAAHAEAVAFIKEKANRDEVIKIAMEAFGMTKDDAEKCFDFVLPALADKGIINMDGVKWAINTVKETNMLKKDISLDQLVDERFYAK